MGKGKEYFFEHKYIVDARYYMPQFDIKDEEQCNNKFDHIQILALVLLKENPDMSRQELVDKLTNLIQESLSIREKQNDQRLVKVKNPKKSSR